MLQIYYDFQPIHAESAYICGNENFFADHYPHKLDSYIEIHNT